MKPYLRWLLRLIGPALLLYFLATTDLSSIVAVFSTLDLLPLAISLLLYPVFVVVKAGRWNLLMRELDLEPPPLLRTTILYMIGLFLGGATPGQSGDFIKAWYLRERGLPLGPVLFSILLDRLFDFVVMALLALLGLFVFLDVLPPAVRLAVVGVAALFIVATLVLMARRPREFLLLQATPLLPARARAVLERWRGQFATLELRPLLLLQLLVVSLASATITMTRIYLLFLALRLDVPLPAVLSSTALIAILQALPISIAGVGVREAVLIPVLNLYGYGAPAALSLSALFLLLNIEHIIVGFLISLRFPLGTPPADARAPLDPSETAAR